MIRDFLFSNPKLAYIKQSMDVSMMRHEAISNNISNVNTPNYKKQEVTFEDELAKALDSQSFKGRKTNFRHLTIGAGSASEAKPKLITVKDQSMRNDGNNVDVDEEMANLSKNTIQYRTLASVLDNELTKINLAITRAGRV
ncbi:MAG TPA: flagellar basal body rod protein FlgB [Candidatus Wallbacteria bacterium]|nr:flagellar basal body rod protein FlgB [Candidatus Wallbacteria bacterium]